jgi:hypothetical protein
MSLTGKGAAKMGEGGLSVDLNMKRYQQYSSNATVTSVKDGQQQQQEQQHNDLSRRRRRNRRDDQRQHSIDSDGDDA